MDNVKEIRWYLLTMSRYRGASLLAILLILLVWILFYLTVPKYYEAVTTIYVPRSKKAYGFSKISGFLKTASLPYQNQNIMAAYLGFLNSEALKKKLASRFPSRSSRIIEKNTRINVYVRYFVFRIFVKDGDPEMAAKIANAYSTEANHLLQEYSQLPVAASRRQLEERIRQTEIDLKGADKRLEDFKTNSGTIAPALEKEHLIQMKTDFMSQLQDTRVHQKEVAANIIIAEKALKKENRMRSNSETVTANPRINNLRASMATIEIAIESALTRYTEDHPEVIRLRTEYKQTQNELEKEIDKVFGSRTRSLNPIYEKLRETIVMNLIDQESLKVRVDGLEGAINNLDNKIKDYPELDKNLIELNRQVDAYEDALRELRKELEEVKLQEVRELDNFRVLDQAQVPGGPVFPDLAMIFLLACISSFLGGVSLPFIIAYLNNERDATGRFSKTGVRHQTSLQ